MYINFPLIKQLGLPINSVLILFAANQNKTSNQSEVLEGFKDSLRHLFDLGLLEMVKAKNKQCTAYTTIRISPKGKKILEDITTADVCSEHLKMRDYLCEIYLNNEDEERVIGNKKLIASHISVLQNHLGLTIHQFYYLCEYFLMEYKFTRKLENIFMDRNKSRYSKFKDVVEDSPLYQFWEQKEEEIRQYFKLKIKND